MKNLKKHPKQQRMEDMTFPLNKNTSQAVFIRRGEKIYPFKGQLGTVPGTNMINDTSPDIDVILDTNLETHIFINGKRVVNTKQTEDITFPLQKDKKFGMYKNSDIRCTHNVLKSLVCACCVAENKDKITWTGREYLRSINDDMGFTIMSRLAWRMVAVGVLVVAVIYFLSTR